MKKSKSYILFLSAALFLNPCMAKDKSPEVAIASHPQVCWLEPGVLALSFGCPSGIEIGAGDMIRISPVFKREGKQEEKFPQVLYMSDAGMRFYERRQTLSPDRSLASSRILLSSDAGKGVYTYTDTLSVGGLSGGLLELSYYYTDCCNEHLLLRDTVVVGALPGETRLVLPLPVLVNRIPMSRSNVVFMKPEKEEVKNRSEKIEVFLHYRLDRSEIEASYMDNRIHLSRVDSVCGPVLGNVSDYKTDNISIVGYASPEGESGYNQALSERRAYSFARYIESRYSLSGIRPEITGGGEDWKELCRLVASDPMMPQREEVLDIVYGYGIFEGRKERLKKLGGGKPYSYMAENIFPKLRRMVMSMDYTVRAFSGEEISRVVATRPQDLDCSELYTAAEQASGSDIPESMAKRREYGKLYDLAARMYPDDVPTVLNAAFAALIRYDLDAAYGYLDRIKDEPCAWNNIGVYYWMCGDTAKARIYFMKASADNPEAGDNLRRLNEWEDSEWDGKEK